MRINKTHLYRKSIYTCLILLCFSLIAFKGKEDIKYVHNLRDFKTHTSIHIQNVYSLGMHLYYKYRNTLFKGIPEHVVREKLLVHDFEKVASIDNLRNAGYLGARPFINRLYDNYGESKNPRMNALISELNSYAGIYDEAIFRKYGLLNSDGTPNEIAKKLAMIEKIADLVEREMNPISKEEFGRKEMRPATEFLTTRLEIRLAQELAKVYPSLVQPNPLIYIAKQSRSAPSCHALFN